MPKLTYPGAHIEELPAGVRTIVGAETSVAAFVGWAVQGPVDAAVQVFSWADYARTFGGLIPGVWLGYAVYHFFQNGGSQACIVRLAAPNAALASVTVSGLAFEALTPGAWGNALTLTIGNITTTSFDVSVSQTVNGHTNAIEHFTRLTVDPSDTAYAPSIINADSQYVRLVGPKALALPDGATPPTGLAPGAPLTGGADGDTLAPMAPGGGFEAALAAPGRGLELLAKAPFSLLVVPGESDAATVAKLQAFCVAKRAFLIVDCPAQAVVGSGKTGLAALGPSDATGATLVNPNAMNSAFYFPWIQAPDLAAGGKPALFPPSGAVAGVYAATDAGHGVWKAPAGTGAVLSGLSGLQILISDAQQTQLNGRGVNCLRQFPGHGDVVFGARTLAGDDAQASDWKYVPVRRLALFIENSLDAGLQWTVFEPNDARLWAQVRLNVGAFLDGLFKQGAFMGVSARQAYFVKCDADNNPASSLAAGVLNIEVGFAALKPAEFVVLQIQQAMQTSAA